MGVFPNNSTATFPQSPLSFLLRQHCGCIAAPLIKIDRSLFANPFARACTHLHITSAAEGIQLNK